MDNASKNAGDMIGSLTLQYNRGRQAAITNELVDIITGAFITVFYSILWINLTDLLRPIRCECVVIFRELDSLC